MALNLDSLFKVVYASTLEKFNGVATKDQDTMYIVGGTTKQLYFGDELVADSSIIFTDALPDVAEGIDSKLYVVTNTANLGVYYFKPATTGDTPTEAEFVPIYNKATLEDLIKDGTVTFTNKTIDADNNTILNLETDNFKDTAIAKTINATEADRVDTKLVTEKAVGAELDKKVDKEDGKFLMEQAERDKLADIYTTADKFNADVIIETDDKQFISKTEKETYADKYTKTEVDNKFSTLETGIDWKESVDSFADIATTYPTPVDGWTVNVKDTDYTYRYNGTEWVAISANSIPMATADLDGKMSKEDKAKLDGIYTEADKFDTDVIIETDDAQFISKAEKESLAKNATYTNAEPMVIEVGGLKPGTTFANKNVTDVINDLLYPYVAPVINSLSVTSDKSGTLLENGEVVTATKLTANVTKKSQAITKVEFFHGDTSLAAVTDAVDKGGSIVTPDGTTIPPIDKTTTVKKFTVKVTDATGTVSKDSSAYTFIYPYYFGKVADGVTPDEAAIKALTKSVESKGNKTKAYTLVNEKVVVAYPKSYGDLKSILDASGFESLTGFTKTEVNVTGLDGTAVAYYVYTLNAGATVTNFNYQFKY